MPKITHTLFRYNSSKQLCGLSEAFFAAHSVRSISLSLYHGWRGKFSPHCNRKGSTAWPQSGSGLGYLKSLMQQRRATSMRLKKRKQKEQLSLGNPLPAQLGESKRKNTHRGTETEAMAESVAVTAGKLGHWGEGTERGAPRNRRWEKEEGGMHCGWDAHSCIKRARDSAKQGSSLFSLFLPAIFSNKRYQYRKAERFTASQTWTFYQQHGKETGCFLASSRRCNVDTETVISTRQQRKTTYRVDTNDRRLTCFKNVVLAGRRRFPNSLTKRGNRTGLRWCGSQVALKYAEVNECLPSCPSNMLSPHKWACLNRMACPWSRVKAPPAQRKNETHFGSSWYITATRASAAIAK